MLQLLVLLAIVGRVGAAFIPPSGVRSNTPQSYLTENGMQECYNAPYSSATYESSFDGCGDASWLFVGAKFTNGDSEFFIGAFGLATDVFRYSYDYTKAHEANGVYWYKVQYYAFGFSAAENINLIRADAATNLPDSRLSWHYNSNNYGGWRAGRYDYLNRNTNFRKVIYKLPNGAAGQPTVMPTAFLPACSVASESYLGDGFCDTEGGYNTAACDYDRGDCCPDTCVDGQYTCGINEYNCLAPQPTSMVTSTPTITPTSTPTAPPTISPTQVPTTALHTLSPTCEPSSSVPTCLPSSAPSAPSNGPSAAPSPAPSTISPTAIPSTWPTAAPTTHIESVSVQSFEFDSTRPYFTGKDIYEAFQFLNMTSYDQEDLYFTTITFSESTMLREDSDFITIYKDSQLTDVYGDREYTGVRFPGMNGEAALGFRSSSFVFHFHSDAGDVPEDHGYSMSVTITRQVASDNSDSGGAAEGTYAGMSRSGVIVLISFCVIVACFSCCGLPYWYLRAHASSKIAMESQDRRKDRVKNVRELEANKIVKRSTKKGKSAMYVEDFGDGKESDVKDKGSSIPVLMCPEGPPPQYTCSISCELMTDPVICADGFTYEREDIEMWLSTHDTSPLTNIALVNKTLIPNLVLKEIIAEYKRSQISKDDAS